ncbi:MAG: class I SAM-dependent methyltransferase [Candidatus Aenigmarchaeota archaeon]|nr:class I SAM-dependent methyltransferase [Candidatus Aenigmarchaeota archaeon]
MRNTSHLSLKYFYNKLKVKLYEKKYPEHPWLTQEANSILSTLLKPTDVGLEFGSGRSTIWFAKRIKHLTSVEQNKFWYDKVFKMIEENNLSNVDLFFQDKNYIKVVDKFKNNNLDFVLIDGILRGECANAIINKVKRGGIIVIDDAHRYFPFPSTVSYSLFKKQQKTSLEWNKFIKQTKNWKYIWTSNGLKDTVIWFKPPIQNY